MLLNAQIGAPLQKVFCLDMDWVCMIWRDVGDSDVFLNDFKQRMTDCASVAQGWHAFIL